ncbi:iron uptake porin [Trichothermofontia sichuanensis B231]|uniref:iron uptake porin n=1 Tax=Trichothermofontia sichuanensis TaxID=3045816 RepID=UPI00224560CB|nr:iron uptake porin [Trichothermofontia sichuanensis B231]
MRQKTFLKSLLGAPTLVGASLLMAAATVAAESPTTDELLSPVADVKVEAEAALESTPLDASLDQAPIEDLKLDTPDAGTSSLRLAPPQPLHLHLAGLSQDTAAIAALSTTSGVNLEQINQYSNLPTVAALDHPLGGALDQVTSVTQLSDVKPTDWAFQALQSLVEKYGCIVGYPDGTFRGQRAMTRYEFAAGLNACLDRINELIAAATADLATKEDLATLQRLMEEFAAELAMIRGRVENLEGRVALLEGSQFSTTTKLQGEAVFGLADAWGGGNLDLDNNQTVFQNRVRLAFVTSFTGKDTLYTRFDAGNARFFDNLDQGAFTYSFDSDNDVVLGWLAYYFPIGKKIQVYLPAAYPLWADFVPTISPYFDGFTGGTRAISSFAESSPIYKIGLAAGGGIGFNYNLSEKVTFSAGYFGGNSFNPTPKNGLFDGEYSILAQLTFKPTDALQIGLTYGHAYFNGLVGDGSDNVIFDLGVGTANAKDPGFGTAVTNSYGIQASYQFSPRFAINAYGGYTNVQQTGGPRDAEIWYYALGLAFPDLGKAGNLGGLLVGAEPYVGGVDDTALHIEGFYKFQLNDNISITPGLIVITAPFGNKDNDTAVVGVVRTTFTF